MRKDAQRGVRRERQKRFIEAAFIVLERLCCPFLEFELDVSGPAQEVWLSFTGREGVKPFLAENFQDLLT